MKFPEIPIGTRFLLKGACHTKVGPLTARRESDGVVRMIPRSAVVTPQGAPSPESPLQPSTAPQWIAEALAAYERTLIQTLAPNGSDPRRRSEIDLAIALARQSFDQTAAQGNGKGTPEPSD